MSFCYADDCDNKSKKRGLCIKHYTRLLRYGDINHTSVIVGDDKKRIKGNSIVVDSGCWEWQRYIKEGYGITILKGQIEQAHRASWKVFIGEIPEGMQVNHKCHNRKCINTEHLYIGTQKQNMQDMIDANRGCDRRGSLSPVAKLNERKVKIIKDLIALGWKIKPIADKYNVCESTIRAIRSNLTWTHV